MATSRTPGFSDGFPIATTRGTFSALDQGLVGISLAQISYDASLAGTYRSGIHYGLKAVAKFETVDDPESEAFAWINLASNYLGLGDCSSCLDAAARAIAIGARNDITRVQSLALTIVGLVRAVGLGEMTAALAASRRAIELASDPYIAALAHYGYVRICTFGRMVPDVSPTPALDEPFEASLAVMEQLARAPLEGPLGPWAGMGLLALANAHLVQPRSPRARSLAGGSHARSCDAAQCVEGFGGNAHSSTRHTTGRSRRC